jgi:hypothetical protein
MKGKLAQLATGLVVLTAIAVGTAGCGSTDISALSVNGNEVSQKTVNDDLKALRDNAAFRRLADRDAANGGLVVSENPYTVTSALSSAWLSNLAQDELIKIAIANRHVKVTAADRAAATSQTQQDFGSKPVFDQFPKFFRDELVARRARAIALARDANADLTTQEGVNTLVAILTGIGRKAHVTVDPRYGTWNPRRLQVDAPRPPGAAKAQTVNPGTGSGG